MPDRAGREAQMHKTMIILPQTKEIGKGAAVMLRKNLQAARKAAGLTQQATADKLGITLRYYQRIEYGESGGSFEVWDALEELLGVHQRKLREISNSRLAPRENR